MRGIRRLRRRDRARGGFTLAELIVAIGLMTLLVSILFAILISAQDIVTDTRRAAGIHENARTAMDFMRDEILNSKPPRNDRPLSDPGQMFVIRNNANGGGDDELWITTGAGVDSKGRPVRKNVRYFVGEDPDLGLKVLRRQEYVDLYADYEAPVTPSDDDTANICEYVEHFDVQYLNFTRNSQYKATIPSEFLPALEDQQPRDINFRQASVWAGSGLLSNSTSPPAIRITMVVRDRRGKQSYFIQKICRVPFTTFDPAKEESPPPTAEDLQ